MDDVGISSERRRMIGIGQKEIETIGAFETNINLDGVLIPVKFHVAREKDILYPAVLGNDILEHVNILINREGAKFSPKTSKTNVGKENQDDI